MSANTTFQLVNEQGWRRGFVNLFRHENAIWWRSRRWWINTLVWLILINGAVLAALSSTDTSAGPLLDESIMVFAVLAGLFGTIGAIIATQGSIIDEKKSGTAAWIMSKPASRPAFILAKLVANMLALFVIILVIQGAVAYVQFSQAKGSPLPLGAFLGGMALYGLNMLFYVSFTLMLGTLFSDRGPVLAIPIGLLFSPMFILNYVGQAAYLLPWPLIPSSGDPGLAAQLMMGQPLSTTMPIVATIVWIVVFIAVALWRFGREEF